MQTLTPTPPLARWHDSERAALTLLRSAASAVTWESPRGSRRRPRQHRKARAEHRPPQASCPARRRTPPVVPSEAQARHVQRLLQLDVSLRGDPSLDLLDRRRAIRRLYWSACPPKPEGGSERQPENH